MKINIGDRLDNIILPSLNGSIFELKSTIGKKLLLTFYRFAACPMCNLRINDLKKIMTHSDLTLYMLLFLIQT